MRLATLLGLYDSMEALWTTSRTELERRGASPKAAAQFCAERDAVDVSQIERRCGAVQLRFVAVTDDAYPPLLRAIPDPPIGLFVRGELSLSTPSLAVVGTRRLSPYGRLVTERLVRPLAENGITIVSGLAFGIDAVAHTATLEVSGRTIAVLAGGLHAVYPGANTALAGRILDNGGALVSEYPPDVEPLPHMFLERNRIIAGLCDGTLVTEAPLKSGALVTAQAALEYGRDVFAVPGPITATASEGTNILLQNGCHVALSSDDILAFYGIETKPYAASSTVAALTETHGKILAHLTDDAPRSIDDLVKASMLTASVVSAALTHLELAGFVRRVDALHYIRISSVTDGKK